MLLLFDVDGTLVRVGGAGRRALERAFEEIVGVRDALQGVRLDGGTDLGIIRAGFLARVGRPPRDDGEVGALLDAYLGFLDEELARLSGSYRVMPGAVELTWAARASGRCAVGLATGNVEPGARKKLARAGLDEAYDFGGFGSDAELRAELVARGIEKGQAVAERTLGRRVPAREVLVIGDTELDVAAARACGAVAVGVLAGSATPDALVASRPDLLVETLGDPALWSAIGLDPGAAPGAR